MSDQYGLKPWAMILIIVLIGILVTIGIFVLGRVFTKDVTPNNPDVYCTRYPSTFVCRDVEVKKCMASDRYTQDQCLQLVGGNSGNK